MATRAYAKSGTKRVALRNPGNPAMTVKAPHLSINPGKDRELVENPSIDAKRKVDIEIGLYGP